MEARQEYKMYDYAKRRIKQRRLLFFNFVLFVLGGILMFCINNFIQDPITVSQWWLWVCSIWAVVLFIQFVNVFIVERFMGKAWQDKEIERLIDLQKKKIEELRKKVEKDFPLVDVKRDLAQPELPKDPGKVDPQQNVE
ncbi:2TM domain-containing protein [Myroides sp. LJL119]